MARKYAKWTDQSFKEKIAELQPNIEILGEYVGTSKRVSCKCKIHNHCWNPIAYTILNGVGCPICGLEKIGSKKRMSNDEFVEKVREKFKNIVPLEEYIDSHTPILFKCLDCNNEFKRSPNNLFNSNGCSECSNSWLVLGENDLKTKRPNLIQFLLDKTDAEKYTYSSSQMIKTKCPVCGYIHEMKVSQLYNRGYNCPICGDNVSFPNKFGRALIEQLPVDNIQHEKFLKIPHSKYRFDSYFEYDNKKYAVEFDGKQHYEETGMGSLEGQRKRDSVKNEYAQKNDIILIRIDCRKSEFEYIKNNILKSKLSELFDLSNVDWEYCYSIALKPITKLICDKYNSEKLSIKELSDTFHFCKSTIERRLKIGTEIGITDYYSEENMKMRKRNGRKQCAAKLGKQVIAFCPDESVYGIYESAAECARQMSSELDKNFHRSLILNICNNKPHVKSHHGYKFKFTSEYDSMNEQI